MINDTNDALGNLTQIANVLRDIARASFATQQILAGGITTNTALPGYTAASLPAGAAAGRLAYATNGRNPAEGAGAGTGTAVVSNGAGVWKAIWSGVAVTV